MTPGRHQRLVGTALVLYAVAALAWVIYHPRNTEALFCAMPLESRMISAHRDLAAHWTAHLTHPIPEAVASALDMASPALIGADPNWQRLAAWLTGPKTVTAWVSHAGWGDDSYSLYAASWIGGARAALFRFLLHARWVPGLGRLEKSAHGTRSLPFLFECPETGRRQRRALSFDVGEGILLMAWSADPDAVRTLAWRLLHRKPVAPMLRDHMPWKDWPETPAPHRFWWINGSTAFDPPGFVQTLEAKVLELSAQRCVLSVTVPAPPALRRETGAKHTASMDLPAFIPDDAPVAIALAAPEIFGIALEYAAPGLFPETNTAMVGWICGAPYEGRIMGILTPALFLAKLFDTQRDPSWMFDLVDVLNARWGMGLTHRFDAQSASPLDPALLIGSSRLGWSGIGRRDSHPGILANLENWFIAGSSAESLRRQIVSASDERNADWRRKLSAAPSDGLVLAFWAEPAKLAREIRYAIALFRLSQIFLGLDGGPTFKGQMDPIAPVRAVDILTAIAPFGNVYGHAHKLSDTSGQISLTLKID